MKEMVGVTGFESATSWTQTRRSTRLSYTPKRELFSAYGEILPFYMKVPGKAVLQARLHLLDAVAGF